ncbi:MAG TPA: xanthine dehydrogenase family protein molybdopterin-binding subunit [Burkholderiales bacterium]|nr:xanthine dehydrogenase family protein molybdopterin-binding subunit [Burkholderiales bacterium]
MTQPFRGRREDDRLLTGRGQYAADWSFPGELYAHFLRSDRAHAEIVSIRTAEAARHAGVVRIFTGEDVAKAGFKTPPPLVRYPGRGGMALKVPERPVLAIGRVRYVGEEVALVLADSAAAAQDAAERIEVEYRDLPVLVEAQDALAPGAAELHAGIAGNLCFDYEYGDEAAAAAALAGAAHVTRLTLDAVRIAGNPMEPKACVALYDEAAQRYELYSPSQGMSMLGHGLTAILGTDRVRVHARDVGGGFGVRSDAYPEYCAALLAAKALGRPVKWVSTRGETLLSDHHGRAAQLGGELALDADGRFLGLRVQWTVNAGAYLSQPGPLINTLNPSTHAINAYRIPALYGRHRLALTNTTPTTAYRGAGRPNVSYLVERLVDEAARETGIDRIELRRRNLIPKHAFPYKTPSGSTYDSGDPAGELDEVLSYSQWSNFPERKEQSAKRGKLRGIGCALFVESAGAGASPQEQAAIRFGDSGNATLHVLAGPSGQGHETVFPEIVAEVLGVPAESITLKASDPEGPALMGGGTVGSRSVMSHGGALYATAQVVVKKGRDLAAKELEVSPGDVDFLRGQYRVRGTDLAVSFQEIARRHGRALDSLEGIPTPTAFPGGAHVAEVEVDPETGEIEVLRYVAVDDCGRVINPVLLDGQLHGGIAQGLGQVLAEQCVYDRASGQLLTGSFMDYPMPRADALSSISLYDHSIPSPGNPLGAKGAGEAGTTGAVPALANAIIDALRALGIHHLDFPYTPARVWRAITQAN